MLDCIALAVIDACFIGACSYWFRQACKKLDYIQVSIFQLIKLLNLIKKYFIE
jgi:hypothetical protein